MATNKMGWIVSSKRTFTIETDDDGADVDAADLGRAYAWVVVRCPDVTHVAADTDTLAIQVGIQEGDEPLTVKDADGDVAITVDGAFQQAIFVGAARYVRLVLSANASGGSVAFEVYGVDGAENSQNAY